MNEKLCRVLSRSLHLMRCARMLPVSGLFDWRSIIRANECHRTAVKKAAPPAQQDVPSMIMVLEHINYRLDAIEEKIDLLLVPMEAVQH